MAGIKTDGTKCSLLWINHCCKISFRRFWKPSSADKWRGQRSYTGSTISWDNTVYDGGGMMEALQKGQKRPFLYAMLTTGSFHIIVLTNWQKLLSGRHFLSSPIPRSILSTAIHFPLVPQERNYRCFAEAFQGEFTRSEADGGLKLWCIRLSPATRWDTRTQHGRGKQ